MLNETGTDRGNIKAILTALLINALTALVCLCVFRPEFETNDDSGLIAIACGARGIRDPHLVHSNYLFGKLLTGLYAANGELQWWSLIQFALLFIAFFMITLVFIRRLSGIAGTLFTAAVIFFFSFEGYTCIQYTKTAGILCAAGLMMLFHGLLEAGADGGPGGKTGRNSGVFFVITGMLLTVFGSFYRFQEFCCIAAVFGAMVVYLIAYELGESDEAGRRIARAAAAGAALLLIAGGLRVYDRAQYRSEEWSDYLEFDKYRTEVLDYGVPDYDAHEAEYNAAGIDRTAYELMKSWTFQDSEKFTAETFRTIAEFRDKKTINGAFVKSFARDFAKGLLRGRTFLCFLVTLAGWIFIGSHRKRNWISLCVLAAVVTALNFYLYYAGRFMVNRVDTGIWLAAVLIVLYQYKTDTAEACSGDTEKKEGSSAAFRNAVLAGCFFLTVAAFAARMPWQDSLKYGKVNDADEKMLERQAIETISSDKDHLYLTKVGTLKFSEAYGVTDAVPYRIADNIYPLGGWGSATPVFRSVPERYGVDNPFRDMIGNEKVYLVDNDIEGTLAYIRRWYKADAEAVPADTVNGHEIYRIK